MGEEESARKRYMGRWGEKSTRATLQESGMRELPLDRKENESREKHTHQSDHEEGEGVGAISSSKAIRFRRKGGIEKGGKKTKKRAGDMEGCAAFEWRPTEWGNGKWGETDWGDEGRSDVEEGN